MAEQVGFDSCFISDHFQPWKHTDGHAPNSLVWLGALGARTQRLVMGTSVLTPTFRYHPSIVAQAFGTLGSMFPRPRHPRHRHRGGAERGALHRRALAGIQGTLRPHARSGAADAQALDRGAGELRGHLLPDREGDDLRPAGDAGADLCRRRRRDGGEIRRPQRRRLHLHQRQEAGALHRDAAAERRGGAGGGRARRSRTTTG